MTRPGTVHLYPKPNNARCRDRWAGSYCDNVIYLDPDFFYGSFDPFNVQINFGLRPITQGPRGRSYWIAFREGVARRAAGYDAGSSVSVSRQTTGTASRSLSAAR